MLRTVATLLLYSAVAYAAGVALVSYQNYTEYNKPIQNDMPSLRTSTGLLLMKPHNPYNCVIWDQDTELYLPCSKVPYGSKTYRLMETET